MPKDATGATGDWWRFSDYELREGYIRPAPGSKLERYNPWEEYRKAKPSRKERTVPPPYEELVNIFRAGPIDINRPLAGFEQAVLGWCRRYGLLGILPHRTQLIALPEEKGAGSGVRSRSQPMYLRTPVGWQRTRHFSVRYTRRPGRGGRKVHVGFDFLPPHALVCEGGTWQQRPLGEALGTFFPSVPEEERDKYRYPLPLSDEFWKLYAEPAIDFRRIAVEFSDIARTAGYVRRPETEALWEMGPLNRLYEFAGTVRPVMTPMLPEGKRQRWRLSWASSSLIGTLALMLIMDICEARRLLNCEACGRLFVTPAYQAKYCSETCYYCAAKRRQRAKKKVAKKRSMSRHAERRRR